MKAQSIIQENEGLIASFFFKEEVFLRPALPTYLHIFAVV